MPTWKRTLDLGDIFHNDALTFAEKRDAMVPRVRSLAPFDMTLQGIADDLDCSDTTDEWDWAWDQFYDWADRSRVWVQTWPRVGV